MNICMVAYSFYETDSRVIMYAEALAKRGDHIDVIALRGDNQAKKGNIRGVNIFRIQKRKINERTKFQYLYRLAKFWILSFVVLTILHIKFKYKVVHIHSVPDFEVFAALLPKLLGAKIIIDIHDIVPELYSSKFNIKPGALSFKMLLLFERISILFSDYVIIANHLWEKTLKKRSATNRKCSTILNYPNPSIFNKPLIREKKNKSFIIIYPGTLNRHQGLDVAIRAFASIQKEAPNVQFHIYGQGPEKRNLEKLIKELNMEGKILMKDWQPIEIIVDLMASADLGIVPKRNESFGGDAFSTKILEFMTLGTPVLVSKTRVDNYYFNNEVVRFFDSENVKDLAGNILDLMKKKEERRFLAENALRFVMKYSWDKKQKEYFQIIDNLVKNKEILE